MTDHPNATALFERIRHGDADHQRWLKEELDRWFVEHPMPADDHPNADDWRKRAEQIVEELRARADDAMGCPELGAALERDRFKAALKAIHSGDYPRERVYFHRPGATSKHDRCEHDRCMWEDCGQCLEQFVEAVLAIKDETL